jgi:uncharacterized protein involved in cysteine biosynthesis
MEIELVIFIVGVLLSVIGFFLAGIFFQLKKVASNVETLMINEATHKTKLQDLERRIEKIESQQNEFLYGNR